ncbi:ethanolamine kinase 1-like isoform X2 [Physella acuta]|uniref:ethanolamine kinase 1-like isoform X2 n=1 Tax=Physella acuta TaxID=109671 RepID=UPI0027DC3745|nr:ethanolamine kinase 1-like isoform X2 [Physella acuta]XP_059170693.1 ethanolamine kinase 1-like isoform X2 [Physella acuta]
MLQDELNSYQEVFTDGITNKLLGCYLEDDESTMVLVRVNGEGTDIIINRAEEQDAFRVLSEADCAPPVYCVFKNGMAYGFFPGVPLDEKTVREPKIQRLIAEELVRLHSVQGSYALKFQGSPPSQYKERVLSWINAAPTGFDDPVKQQVFINEIPSKIDLIKELDEIAETLDALNMNSVFSHNDLLLKNIIFNEKEGSIRFIDYEYAFYNYEAFDIGNHFAEYAGMEEVNYDLYPSKEEQLPWLRHYLEVKASKTGSGSATVTDRDVQVLYVQTNKCACAAHFFWGVWALIQAEHSLINFNYVQYASIRLTEYFRRKKEFFPLLI